MDPQEVTEYLTQEEEEEDEEIHMIVATCAQLNQMKNSSNIVRHGGSVFNHRVINRNRALGHQLIYRDYFSDDPSYPDYIFCRRFRMRRSLFLRIQAAIESHDPYFVQKCNAAGVPGLSSFQKITAALRMIAYGVPADSIDDYIRIGESTAIESLRKFVISINQIFGEQYLRSPNKNDIKRLTEIAEGVSGNVREHRLYALEVEKLPDCLAWSIFGSLSRTNNYT